MDTHYLCSCLLLSTPQPTIVSLTVIQCGVGNKNSILVYVQCVLCVCVYKNCNGSFEMEEDLCER